MPSSFDYSWSSGPFGPPPLFWLLSGTDNDSERHYVLANAPALYGANVYQLAGAIVQYATSSTTPAPIFRRTTMARSGSRGIVL